MSRIRPARVSTWAISMLQPASEMRRVMAWSRPKASGPETVRPVAEGCGVFVPAEIEARAHGAAARLQLALEVDLAGQDLLQEGLEPPALFGLLEPPLGVGHGERVEDEGLRVREGLRGHDVGAEEAQAPRDAGEEAAAVPRHHHQLPAVPVAGEARGDGAAGEGGHEREMGDGLDGRR